MFVEEARRSAVADLDEAIRSLAPVLAKELSDVQKEELTYCVIGMLQGITVAVERTSAAMYGQPVPMDDVALYVGAVDTVLRYADAFESYQARVV